jgi:hypothetical protein
MLEARLCIWAQGIRFLRMQPNLLTDVPEGFYPFWFWNGVLTKEELRWQILEMHKQGVKGFFIHLRQGMDVPYLSESFFELVRFAIDEAVKVGMKAQLYDEYPYPSGAAGGEVVMGRPDLYATRLVHQVFEIQGPTKQALAKGYLLSCMAYPVNDGVTDWKKGIDLKGHVGVVLRGHSYNEIGLTSYGHKRFLANDPVPTLWVDGLTGTHKVVVTTQAVVDDHKYYTHFIDPLNPAAVARFIQVTHERYARQLGDRMGKAVKSIFTDETSPGWSPVIPRAFKAKYGYDLLEAMPAVADATHPDAARVRMDLKRLKLEMFIESFEKPLQKWCAQHGIAYVAEKPMLRLSQHRHVDVPGCEPGHTKAGRYPDVLGYLIRGNARATVSAAYFYDKPATICECFHSMSWGATLQDVRLLSDALILLGITWLTPHGFFYSTHALAKHDAPPSFFFQMPYWPLFGSLSARVERLAQAYLRGTEPTAQVLLVEPHSGTENLEELKAYERLMHVLMGMQIEFLHVDTDVLQGGEVSEGKVRIKGAEYGVVIVPQMSTMEEAQMQWLEGFKAKGGVVLDIGAKMQPAEIRQSVGRVARSALGIKAVSGTTENLWLGTRKDDSGRLAHFLVNVGKEPVEILIQSRGALREVPLDDALPGMLRSEGTGYLRRLEAFEGALLEASDQQAALPGPVIVDVVVDRAIAFKPVNKNLLRLYKWTMCLPNEPGSPEGIVAAIPVANQLAKSKLAFAPKWDMGFGKLPRVLMPGMDVRYEASFDVGFEGKVELVMEPGSLVGQWTLLVNESEPVGLSDFAPTDAHVRGSLGVDITRWLRPGRNRITIELKTDQMEGGLINAIYLAGDFAVELGRQAHGLAAGKRQGEFEAWEANGLPFYAGVLECEGSFELSGEAAARNPELLRLRWPCRFEEAVEVSVNGGPWRRVLWSPALVKVEPGEVKPGKNQIKVRVHTSLLRAFEGQRFDIDRHEMLEV